MATWDDYKKYVKSVDPDCAADIDEAEEMAHIVSILIKQRTAMGLSQRELAKQCNMPQSAIARIETGKTVPKLNTLLRIMHQLNLQISVFNSSAPTKTQLVHG